MTDKQEVISNNPGGNWRLALVVQKGVCVDFILWAFRPLFRRIARWSTGIPCLTRGFCAVPKSPVPPDLPIRAENTLIDVAPAAV